MDDRPAIITRQHRLAVVGYGLHGLLLSHELLRSIGSERIALTVIDPHRTPAAVWTRRVARCGMGYLRSPGSHALCSDFGILRMYGAQRPHAAAPPYHRPSIGRFAEHIAEVGQFVDRNARRVRGRVIDLHQTDGSQGYWCVSVDGRGQREEVGPFDAVVLAIGQPPPLIPAAIESSFRESAPQIVTVLHAEEDPNLPPLEPGSLLLIAGGGIAAGHAALRATERGIRVELWHEQSPTVHRFDSDPCFVGPACSTRFREIVSYPHRRDLIRRVRRPGSLPPELARALVTAEERGMLRRVRARLEGVGLGPSGARAFGKTPSGTAIHADVNHVTLATGFETGPPAAKLLDRISQRFGAPRAGDGFPVPSASLEWRDGLYLSGALAELELGPPARNIIGAHLAARRIIPALLNRFGLSTTARIPSRARRPPPAPVR